MPKQELQILVAEQKILNRIYVFRGQKVMIDEDLAEIYNVETRRLNEQVKRNIKPQLAQGVGQVMSVGKPYAG